MKKHITGGLVYHLPPKCLNLEQLESCIRSQECPNIGPALLAFVFSTFLTQVCQCWFNICSMFGADIISYMTPRVEHESYRHTKDSLYMTRPEGEGILLDSCIRCHKSTNIGPVLVAIVFLIFFTKVCH